MSMPTPVTTQPIRRGPGAALAAIWEGSAKMPLPIIDPTTIAVRAARPRPALGIRGRVSGGCGMRDYDIVCLPVQLVRWLSPRITDAMAGACRVAESLVPRPAA